MYIQQDHEVTEEVDCLWPGFISVIHEFILCSFLIVKFDSEKKKYKGLVMSTNFHITNVYQNFSENCACVEADLFHPDYDTCCVSQRCTGPNVKYVHVSVCELSINNILCSTMVVNLTTYNLFWL